VSVVPCALMPRKIVDAPIFSEGITVLDANDKPMGTSVAAGRHALAQIALTRVVLPVPILLLPPFLLGAWSRWTSCCS
jgi:hypothetical protein